MRVQDIWVSHADLGDYVGISPPAMRKHRVNGNLQFEEKNGREYVSHVHWANAWIERQGYDVEPIESDILEEFEWLQTTAQLVDAMVASPPSPEHLEQSLEEVQGLMRYGVMLFHKRLQTSAEGTSLSWEDYLKGAKDADAA